MIRHCLLAAAFGGAMGCAAAEPVRDPFARPFAARVLLDAAPAAAEPEPALQLRAIIFNLRRPLVNINGQILTVGESIGDYRVARIEERSVVLSKGSMQRVLALEPESIQK